MCALKPKNTHNKIRINTHMKQSSISNVLSLFIAFFLKNVTYFGEIQPLSKLEESLPFRGSRRDTFHWISKKEEINIIY